MYHLRLSVHMQPSILQLPMTRTEETSLLEEGSSGSDGGEGSEGEEGGGGGEGERGRRRGHSDHDEELINL